LSETPPTARDQVNTAVMTRLRNYWVYSGGLLVAWLIVLIVSTVVGTGDRAKVVLMVFGGFAIGWVSTTIARYVYPPPAKWTHTNG
jgi:hypothetical protein